MKRIFLSILTFFIAVGVLPPPAFALTMGEIMGQAPASQVQGVQVGAEAMAYIVIDKSTGQVMLSKNTDKPWPPASLTKLVTALVFLDSKVSLDKVVTMKKEDEVGGSRLNTKTGLQYKARDLLHASLIASNNNATNALSRAGGLTRAGFVALMNQKAKELGAKNTHFLEPTGIDPLSYTTAEDFSKIVTAAFGNSYLSLVAKKDSYSFSAVNNKKYLHKLASTNKLLSDADITVIGGKTGYLQESRYNFATITKDRLGNEFIIVVLGAGNPTQQFNQTKQLALQATAMKVFGLGQPQVAGTSTTSTSTLINK